MTRRTAFLLRACAFLALAACLATTAIAADIAPLLPAPDSLPAPAPAPQTAQEAPAPGDGEAPPDPSEVLVKSLGRVAFEYFKPLPPRPLPTVVAPAASGIPGVDNAVSALDSALACPGSDLARAVRAALDGEFTWGELEALTDAATEAARAAGWSLAYAFAPEQELTGGVLRIEVIPVWLEDVAVKNVRWSNPERLRRPYLPFAGGVMRLDDMQALHNFQNTHPFRRIAPSLSPGAVDGSTVYTLDVQEKKPWRAYTGYTTTHSRTSGSGRFNGGVTMAAPWRTDDVLTVQYSTDSQFDHLDSVALVYRHALPWRHFLDVTALWSESDTQSDQYFAQTSKDAMFRLAYVVPLPEWRGWTHQAEFGWEWRRSHAVNDFSGATYFDNVYVSAPLFAGWRGRRPDAWGATGLSVDVAVGPGSYMGRMERSAYDKNRKGAKREWVTVRPEIRRDWRLPGDFIATQRAWAQWSPQRLADAALFYLGGNNTVRGYRESEVSGDKGLGVSLEVMSPSLTKLFARPVADAAAKDKAEPPRFVKPETRLAAFWDWGVVKRNGTLESYERKSTVMNGAGVGVRFFWGEWIHAQVDYAWRLRDTGRREDDRKNGFLHATVNIGF